MSREGINYESSVMGYFAERIEKKVLMFVRQYCVAVAFQIYFGRQALKPAAG